jgi:hypothetical protein
MGMAAGQEDHVASLEVARGAPIGNLEPTVAPDHEVERRRWSCFDGKAPRRGELRPAVKAASDADGQEQLAQRVGLGIVSQRLHAVSMRGAGPRREKRMSACVEDGLELTTRNAYPLTR